MAQSALMFQSSPDGRNRITKQMAKQVPAILRNQFELVSRESLLLYSLIPYIFRFPCHLMSCIWFIWVSSAISADSSAGVSLKRLLLTNTKEGCQRANGNSWALIW